MSFHLWAATALKEKAERLRQENLPRTDKLSKAVDQTEECREYMRLHAEEIKQAIVKLEALAKDLINGQ